MAKANVAKIEPMAVSVPRITTKKSRFTAKVDGDENKLGDEIYAIILGISPDGLALSKTFYTSGYTDGSNDAPDCSSTNGVVPDAYIQKPQHNVCATCPKNQWGSAVGMNDKKAKACKESKRLFVVLAEDAMKEKPTLYMLTITVNTFKNFSDYGKTLRAIGITSPCFVITKFTFDEESSVPKLCFENVGFLEEEPMMKLLPIAEERPWQQLDQAALAVPDTAEALPEVAYTPAIVEPTKTATASDIGAAIDNW
jgi:hypothetical protein